MFVSLPGEIPWTTFRDVYEVDGRAVREREARLERLFMRPSRDAFGQADRILRESARYNLGEAFRTVNVPTLALLFLHARNQPRFSFARKGSRLLTAYVSTAFKREPPLDAHVPVEMKELYLTGAGRIEATVRYSNFRRFQVATEERLEGIGPNRPVPVTPAPLD